MSQQTCSGDPTFNLAISDNAYSEWPAKIGGLICKTPPMGSNNQARFAECCSGKVYNITSPTTPDDQAYPMSCALFCQVDPAFDALNDKYPYHFSDYFMCLTSGDYEDGEGGEVVCATNPVDGKTLHPSFTSTPSGSWQTVSYAIDSLGFPLNPNDPTATPSSPPTISAVKTSVTKTSTTDTSTTGVADMTTTAPATSSSSSLPATTSEEALATTTTPNGATRNLNMGIKACIPGLLYVLAVAL